jgi:hypothetical protein
VFFIRINNVIATRRKSARGGSLDVEIGKRYTVVANSLDVENGNIDAVDALLSLAAFRGVCVTSPLNDVVVTHGAMVKRCSHEGCANGAFKGGVCIARGAKVKRCQEGCANGVNIGGVCFTHGARVKRCSQEGCAPTEPSRGAFALRTARR